MATPASLNFTPLTNNRVWFASKDAFNNWFASITVSINNVNIPAATLTTLGGVKQMALSAFAPTPATVTYVTLNADDGTDPIQVPSKDAYDTLKTEVDYLTTALTELYTQLNLKGYKG